MSTEDLGPLDDTLRDIVARLAPPERVKLGRQIATELRKANARRIRQNVTPAGAPMPPRKSLSADRREAGRKTRAERMFQGAAKATYLRRTSSASEAQVGFDGAMVRIMRIHQLGLPDAVSRAPGAPTVVYPVREVLGMNEDDRLRILDQVAAQLSA